MLVLQEHIPFGIAHLAGLAELVLHVACPVLSECRAFEAVHIITVLPVAHRCSRVLLNEAVDIVDVEAFFDIAEFELAMAVVAVRHKEAARENITVVMDIQ